MRQGRWSSQFSVFMFHDSPDTSGAFPFSLCPKVNRSHGGDSVTELEAGLAVIEVECCDLVFFLPELFFMLIYF